MGVTSIGKTAFDVVYDANAESVYQVAMQYSGNHYVAEEITQNAFMKLYINMNNVNMRAVRKWLLTTAKHMAMNYKRDYAREITKEELLFEDAPGELLEDEFLRRIYEKDCRELMDNIFAELYQVNKRWYEAVTITYLLEKPQKEVAETMGVSLEVLHSMLYRAKKWIKKQYEEQYDHLNKA